MRRKPAAGVARRITGIMARLASVAWCVAMVAPSVSVAQNASRPPGWSESTHGAKVAPAYQRLFAMTKVHELRITIASEGFRKMQADLETIGPGRGRGALLGFGAPFGGRGGPADEARRLRWRA